MAQNLPSIFPELQWRSHPVLMPVKAGADFPVSYARERNRVPGSDEDRFGNGLFCKTQFHLDDKPN